MKKILSVVLAVAMLLSVGSMLAFADGETATLEIAVVDGAAPTAVNDVFKVEVRLTSVSTNTLSGVAAEFSYNPEVVALCDSEGNLATKASTLINRADMYDADEEEGVFAFTDRSVDFANGDVSYSLYIHQDQKDIAGAADTGITLEGDYALPFTVISMYFKVIGEGSADIALKDTSIVNYAPGKEVVLSYVNPTIVIAGGDTPEPEKKTITSIADATLDAVDAPAEGADDVTVALPTTVTATLSDGTTVELPVAWEPTAITVTSADAGKELTAAGTVTVDADTYELAEGVAATVTASLKVNENDEPTPPETKTITAIDAVEVTTYVGAAPVLPEKVTAKVGDEETVDVDVVWDAVAAPTEAGTTTVDGTITVPDGYVLAEGVTTTVTATITAVDAPVPSKLPVVAELVCVDGSQGKVVQMKLSLNEDYDGDAEAALDGSDIVVAFNFMNGNTPVQRQAVFQIISKNAVVSGDVAMGFTGVAIPEGTTSITAGIVQNFDPVADITVDNLGEAIAVAAPITIE